MTEEMDFFAPFRPNIPSLWNLQGGGLDYAEKAYRAWFETAGRIQGDAMEFVRHRLEKDVAAVADFGKCKTAVEAFNVQFAYAQDAFADFVGEGQRITALLSNVARDMGGAVAFEPTAEPKRTLRKGGAQPASH